MGNHSLEPGQLLLVNDPEKTSSSPFLEPNFKKGGQPVPDYMTSIQYVLTVDDDLYRRVVKEMAYSRFPCGIYYCCHETDTNKVNIWVAVGILSIIFLFLFVNTMIWPVT